ncbi:hypothetical protein TWF718_004938 [Orbilia javanica]|uniref:PHD-type domain-containing protein n=1 Tax=Orbilia javanica TaxID=47235 RepID=A0AAN8N6P2_9PEZI
MASPILISGRNTPQPQTTRVRDGSNIHNAIVIDDNDDADVQPSNNRTVLQAALINKPDVVILDLTGGSATPPPSRPLENIPELPCSEVPVESSRQQEDTLSQGPQAQTQQTGRSASATTDGGLPDTAVNSMITSSQDKTPHPSQERNSASADRPSPQRHGSRSRTKGRNGPLRLGGVRRSVGNTQLWDDDDEDIVAVGRRSNPATDAEAESFCKTGRLVQCPGQDKNSPHQTTYSEQKVDEVLKYRCFPGCGYIVSVADYKKMVYENLMRGAFQRGVEAISSGDLVEKEVVPVESSDNGGDAMEADGPSPANQSVQDHQNGALNNTNSPPEPLELLDMEVPTAETVVENNDPGDSLPIAVVPTDIDIPVVESSTIISEFVPPQPPQPPVDISAAKEVSESSQDIVEEIRAEDVSGLSGLPAEHGTAPEPPVELPARSPTPAEPQQPIQTHPISSTPLPPIEETTHQTDEPPAEPPLSKDSTETENIEAPQLPNPPQPPSETMPGLEENAARAVSPATSTTLTNLPRPKAPSKSKTSRRVAKSSKLQTTPAPVEDVRTAPKTRSSVSRDVCVACRRENSGLSADHPVKCQMCKRAWHRSCNAGLENMGYKVTSWTCRSCSRSRKSTTRSETPSVLPAAPSAKKTSRRSSGSSTKRPSGGLYGLGPKKSTKNTIRRVSSNSPSITLATPENVGVRKVVDLVPAAMRNAEPITSRKRIRSLSPQRGVGTLRSKDYMASPRIVRTRVSLSCQNNDKPPSPTKGNPVEEQGGEPVQTTETTRERHASLSVGPGLEQDTTLVTDLEPPSKRQRLESPCVVPNEDNVTKEPIVIEELAVVEESTAIGEPMALDGPQFDAGERVLEGYAAEVVAVTESTEAENGTGKEQNGDLAEPVDGSKEAPALAQTAPTSPRIGKFKPMQTKTLRKFCDMIVNSGTSLEPPRREEPETPTIPEQPQAPPEEDIFFAMESPQAQDPLSIAMTANQEAHLTTDMPCDLRMFEGTGTLSPVIDPGDINLDAEFETLSENREVMRNDEVEEAGERYNTQVEEPEPSREECSPLEKEVSNEAVLTDNVLQPITEQQQLGEKLKVANEECKRHKEAAKEAQEECEKLKRRVEALEKQIGDPPGDTGRIIELKEQLASIKARYEDAEAELNISRARGTEFERLHKRCEVLQNRLNDSRKDYRQLVKETEGQAGKLEAAINERNDIDRRMRGLKFCFDQVSEGFKDATTELRKSKENCKNLEQSIRQLEIQATRVQLPGLANIGTGGIHAGTSKQIEDLENLNAELRTRLDNMSTQSVYSAISSKRLRAQIGEIEKHREALVIENAKLKLSNDSLEKNLGNRATQDIYSKEQWKDLWKQLNDKDTKIKDLKEENKKLEEAKTKLEEENKKLEDAKTGLEAAKTGLEGTMAQNETELENLKSSNLTHELMKDHYEEEIRTLKTKAEAEKANLENQISVLEGANEQQLSDSTLAQSGLRTRVEEQASKIKDLEGELERRKEAENSLRERLEAAERRFKELEASAPRPQAPEEPEEEFPFNVSHPMLPGISTLFDAAGDLPEGYQIKTTQPRKERYEAWYNRNPKDLHLHRSCNRGLPAINGTVKVFELDGSECNTEDDEIDLRGRTRKRGQMTFDEFRGVNDDEVTPVSVEKCGKVVFRKIEKSRRTGGPSRHAVIYKTGRNVPGELRN